jgi:hypothetical protein
MATMNDTDDGSRDEAFDACPICRCYDDLLDVNGRFFLVCHDHETAWYAGVASFASWRESPEDDAERVARWKSNAALLLTYELRQRGRHAHRGL